MLGTVNIRILSFHISRETEIRHPLHAHLSTRDLSYRWIIYVIVVYIPPKQRGLTVSLTIPAVSRHTNSDAVSDIVST